ncbi:TonB-dependent receptor [Lacihabitans sp. LS3-19]|uniref:carboxypeptidase-like regulatory domain-containing protein n=1 Tax=Lacihabitans sp. LS3-19 TaxID=2487335 RepID=UPI0020CD2889|nr:carboxypeptidase-like regulatory domain-containing protein [Lacihabitans sp. LS3-19]MCP9770781.1 TonB-dependent receptor [Lacihabitans sp. LS3-19]
MNKNLSKLKKLFLFLAICLVNISFASAQTVISGMISDAKTKEPLVGISVQIKGKVIGTITDVKGKFEFSTSTPLPFQLVISSVGYKSQEYTVDSENAAINISLEDQDIMGQEVVVSASRVEQSVMKSPVTVEKLDLRAIRETASPNFYDAIANMKGVDMTTQGLLFKSINMRGFGATGNPRTVQMIDGMDNSAPGLNFPVDNIVGMPELDVESVEILPGAASALYGPNAINGLVLMNSKSPFLYQGLSSTIKTGLMSETSRSTATTPFYDLSMRYAKAFNNKFAFKVNVAYIGAKDWEANNFTNLNVGGVENGTRGAGVDPDYDGVNIYGDEVQANMLTVANGLVAAKLLPSAATALVPNIPVSRTGFIERDLVDYNTKSFKTNLGLHYRINEKVVLIGQLNYGYGTTVYTGAARYSLRNFNITQAKLELKGDNFNIRSYTTQERSGKSYASGLSAVSMLNEIKPHATWFGQYVGAFVAARSAGQSEDAAQLTARGVADQGMPAQGSDALLALADKYNKMNIVDGGGAFADKSNVYHLEGYYNFKNQVKFMDLSVGANLRQYQLRSNGTLFADLKDGRNGTIGIQEYGGFIQAAKSMFADHFKLSASMRYDKNENFDGQFTPRISGVFSFGEHNIRLSYQSGFRIPTTQNQYIDLKTASGTLIGGLPEFDTRYNLANGIAVASLTSANIAKYAADPTVQAQAKGYAVAAITAQATPAITAGVTAAITQQVSAGVTAVITQQVIDGVTASITQSVTQAVTAGITQSVTDAVTASVNAAVTAGQLAAEAAPAAIQAGVAAQLPAALNANLQPQVAAALPGALAANLQPGVDATLPGALAANLQPGIDATLPGALAANFQPAFDAELKKAIDANSPGVIAQVLPAYALAAIPKYQVKALQPERIQSYEIGYKGLWGKKLFVDAYHYWSKYTNFIGGTSILVPTAAAGPGLPIESGVGSASTRLAYSRPSNTSAVIKVKGWAANANYSLGKGYNVGGNVAYNELTNFVVTPEQLYAGFNTPKYRYNMNFGKRLGSGDKIGFNVNFRHQDEFIWESSFVSPTTTSNDNFTNTTVPKINNLDAQVSFKLPAAKSIVKVGATNIGSKPYFQAFGSAMVGSTYYVTISYDELFNR